MAPLVEIDQPDLSTVAQQVFSVALERPSQYGNQKI